MTIQKEPIGFRLPGASIKKLLSAKLIGLLSQEYDEMKVDHITFYYQDKKDSKKGEYITFGYMTKEDRDEDILSVTGMTPESVKRLTAVIEEMEGEDHAVSSKS